MIWPKTPISPILLESYLAQLRTFLDWFNSPYPIGVYPFEVFGWDSTIFTTCMLQKSNTPWTWRDESLHCIRCVEPAHHYARFTYSGDNFYNVYKFVLVALMILFFTSPFIDRKCRNMQYFYLSFKNQTLCFGKIFNA